MRLTVFVAMLVAMTAAAIVASAEHTHLAHSNFATASDFGAFIDQYLPMVAKMVGIDNPQWTTTTTSDPVGVHITTTTPRFAPVIETYATRLPDEQFYPVTVTDNSTP